MRRGKKNLALSIASIVIKGITVNRKEEVNERNLQYVE